MGSDRQNEIAEASDLGHAGKTTSLGWPRKDLGFLSEELGETAGEREVWASLLKLLPPRPNYGYAEVNGWMHESFVFFNWII